MRPPSAAEVAERQRRTRRNRRIALAVVTVLVAVGVPYPAGFVLLVPWAVYGAVAVRKIRRPKNGGTYAR